MKDDPHWKDTEKVRSLHDDLVPYTHHHEVDLCFSTSPEEQRLQVLSLVPRPKHRKEHHGIRMHAQGFTGDHQYKCIRERSESHGRSGTEVV